MTAAWACCCCCCSSIACCCILAASCCCCCWFIAACCCACCCIAWCCCCIIAAWACCCCGCIALLLVGVVCDSPCAAIACATICSTVCCSIGVVAVASLAAWPLAWSSARSTKNNSLTVPFQPHCCNSHIVTLISIVTWFSSRPSDRILWAWFRLGAILLSKGLLSKYVLCLNSFCLVFTFCGGGTRLYVGLYMLPVSLFCQSPYV